MCFHLAQTTMTHGCERPRSSGGTNLLPVPAPALPRPSDPSDRSALACAWLSSAPGPGPGPCSTHRGPGAVPPTPQTAGPRSTSSPPAPAWPLSPRAGRTPPRAAGPQGLGGCWAHTAQTGPGCRVPAPPAPQSSQSQALLPQPLRGRGPGAPRPAFIPLCQQQEHHSPPTGSLWARTGFGCPHFR